MENKLNKLHTQAVDAALDQNWSEAIACNLELLALDPSYIDAYLGLGFAYMQTGKLKDAKAQYKAALDIDPVNLIALNNIDKLNILLKNGSDYNADDVEVSLSPETFMHTEGRTRVVTLSNIGQAEVLARLKIGEHVYLKAKKRRIEVRTKKGDYVGALPDDISKRIAFFIEASSEYDTIIKAATKNTVDVFIKETVKGSKVKHYISFPDNIQDDLKRIMHHNEHEGLGVTTDGSMDGSDDSDAPFDEDEVIDLDRLAHRDSAEDEDDDIEYLSELENDDTDPDEDEM